MVRSSFVFSICILIAGCERPEKEQPAVPEPVQDFYDKKLRPPVEDATEWVKGDLAKHGDWQYHVVTLVNESDENLAAKLNELGAERWEVVWIEKPPEARFGETPYRVFLKRPSKSLLRSIKVPDLGSDRKE